MSPNFVRFLVLKKPSNKAGMDSLSAVELRRKLAEAASSQGSKKFQLPSTVAFDFPTVRALAEYLDQSVPQQFVEAPVAAARLNGGAPRTMVAGEASKLPGAHATDAEAWTIFQQQVDAVTEIPLLRFDVNECFDPTAAGVGFLTYARHASFIDGVEPWCKENKCVDLNEEVNALTSHFSFCCEMFVLDNNFELQLTALRKLWFGLVTL